MPNRSPANGPTGGSKFYGFLANGHTAALVSPEGSIDWLPWPRFDSSSVFSRLLGNETHGYYALEAVDSKAVEQRYLPGTNILETRWEGPGGRALVRDYLAIGRPELRRLSTAGIPMMVTLRPSFGYGRLPPLVQPLEGGAVFRHPRSGESLVFRIRVDRGGAGWPQSDELLAEDEVGTEAVGLRWFLPPGRYTLVLRYVADYARQGSAAGRTLVADAKYYAQSMAMVGRDRSLTHNIRFWRQLPRGDYAGPYREALERSLLVLRGLIYRTNGAIIAAPTTSLPEIIGQGRQWDYRFVWVRDGSYAAEALLVAGDIIAARRFLEFLLNVIDLQGKPFQAPFYRVDATLTSGERELSWLPGFRGNRPVREGNAATHQQQLDIEGAFLWVVYRYYQVTGDKRFLRTYWQTLTILIDWVRENWHLPDAGLWEFRGQDKHHTHSKVMGWVTLHYGALLAEALGSAEQAAEWDRVAAAIRHDIELRGFNAERNRYTQCFGDEDLDASLLVMPLYGYTDVGTPRFQATLAEIERELVRGPWVHRYRGDMFGRATHPFVLASFWLVRVYIAMGHRDRARRLLVELMANRTDLGLLGEHADHETGEPRGNFPQAFSHLGLILAIMELDPAPGA